MKCFNPDFPGFRVNKHRAVEIERRDEVRLSDPRLSNYASTSQQQQQQQQRKNNKINTPRPTNGRFLVSFLRVASSGRGRRRNVWRDSSKLLFTVF